MLMRRPQVGRELTLEYSGHRSDRKQELRRTCGLHPLAFTVAAVMVCGQSTTGNNGVHMDMALQLLPPGVFGRRAALWAVTVTAGVVVTLAVAAGVAGQAISPRARQCGRQQFLARLWPGVLRGCAEPCTLRQTGGHERNPQARSGQAEACQKGQGIDAVGRTKLRTYQVQVAPCGGDIGMAQQLLDGVQVYAALQKMCCRLAPTFARWRNCWVAAMSAQR
jgi:hypothetical protein